MTISISLLSLHKKSYSFIEKYVNVHRNQFISLVNMIRSVRYLPVYNYQESDLKLSNDFALNFDSYVCLKTTPDGNCLYNAVSLNLFGMEDYWPYIKLAMIFILFEYEPYFREYIREFSEYSFEGFIENTAKYGSWGNEINILALSVVSLRPMLTLTQHSNLWCNPTNSIASPLILALKSYHFSSVVYTHYYARFNNPTQNQLAFFKRHLGQIIHYY